MAYEPITAQVIEAIRKRRESLETFSKRHIEQSSLRVESNDTIQTLIFAIQRVRDTIRENPAEDAAGILKQHLDLLVALDNALQFLNIQPNKNSDQESQAYMTELQSYIEEIQSDQMQENENLLVVYIHEESQKKGNGLRGKIAGLSAGARSLPFQSIAGDAASKIETMRELKKVLGKIDSELKGLCEKNSHWMVVGKCNEALKILESAQNSFGADKLKKIENGESYQEIITRKVQEFTKVKREALQKRREEIDKMLLAIDRAGPVLQRHKERQLKGDTKSSCSSSTTSSSQDAPQNIDLQSSLDQYHTSKTSCSLFPMRDMATLFQGKKELRINQINLLENANKSHNENVKLGAMISVILDIRSEGNFWQSRLEKNLLEVLNTKGISIDNSTFDFKDFKNFCDDPRWPESQSAAFKDYLKKVSNTLNSSEQATGITCKSSGMLLK